MDTVKQNLSELRKDIAPCKAKIIAVTKYFGADKLIEAYEAGLRDLRKIGFKMLLKNSEDCRRR